MGCKLSVVIVGFMGTGKTVVGSELAKGLGVGFLDTDRLIEEAQGMSIAEIFRQKGEKAFRKMEKQVVCNVVSSAERDPCVVATGGGTVVDSENCQRLQTIGMMVCLQADPEVIFARTANDAGRPLLLTDKNMDRLSAIDELLTFRRPFYEMADMCIDTSKRSVGDIVASVIGHLNTMPGASLKAEKDE